ncbi:hypothetical protein GCM10011418_16800 [Sphingobacterium alkalisoli]|nr:hypothetical protein GCM10011418_16800 [Sphingobacterium alkalisoli]
MFMYGLLLVFLSCSSHASKDESSSDTSQSDPIKENLEEEGGLSNNTPRSVDEIRRLYEEVNFHVDQGNLDTTSFSYNCHGEKKGKLTYYSKNGNVVMITHKYNEYDHYEATDHYYVQNDSLYFVFQKGVAWSFESGTPNATKDNVTEKRVYLADLKPIHCLEKKYVIRSHANDNPDSETLNNQEIDCSSSHNIYESYQVLAKYYQSPTSGCLE